MAAIADLQIGSGTSPIASYVALTRVKTRNDLLIFRPFSHELFTRGTLEGPELPDAGAACVAVCGGS